VSEVQEMSRILTHGQKVISQTDNIEEIHEMNLKVNADNKAHLHVYLQ
jgi:hypothetical protein